MIALARPAWAYRGFILASLQREFQSKYRNSLLGAAWTVIQPLSMVLVYTLIFSQVMRARLPGLDSSFAFSIYLCAGILTWGLFQEIIGRAQTIFVDNANLIKKVSFPRVCLPVIAVMSAGINFTIIFGLFTIFLVVTGNFPGVAYVAILPVLVIHVAFAIGLGVIFGVLHVFFRDVGQFVGILLQFWFWFTPIVYPITILPEWAQGIMRLNPLTWLAEAYQGILVYGRWPNWLQLLPVLLLAIALCAFGMRLFSRRVGEIVDEL
jgi:homopolymeric O-antigen transport system permease protein